MRLGKYALTAGDERILKNIVSRCHVGDSLRDVLRYVYSRIKTPWKDIPREQRRALMSFVSKQHDENRRLYLDVMSGNIGGVDNE